MKCNIEYVGKLRNGKCQYYCTTHKSVASDGKGNRLEACLCKNKELFDNPLNLKNTDITDLKIVYSNILKNRKPSIFVNGNLFDGVFIYDNSILNFKDLGGIMLSNLNDIFLEKVKCSHCNHYHSDNGKFAYTPHRTHLCLYCGHLFRVKEKNIGNEFSLIFNIPKIMLQKNKIYIDDDCCVEYDLFKGQLLINKENVNEVVIQNKQMSVIEFLNDMLKDEF